MASTIALREDPLSCRLGVSAASSLDSPDFVDSIKSVNSPFSDLPSPRLEESFFGRRLRFLSGVFGDSVKLSDSRGPDNWSKLERPSVDAVDTVKSSPQKSLPEKPKALSLSSQISKS